MSKKNIRQERHNGEHSLEHLTNIIDCDNASPTDFDRNIVHNWSSSAQTHWTQYAAVGETLTPIGR